MHRNIRDFNNNEQHLRLADNSIQSTTPEQQCRVFGDWIKDGSIKADNIKTSLRQIFPMGGTYYQHKHYQHKQELIASIKANSDLEKRVRSCIFDCFKPYSDQGMDPISDNSRVRGFIHELIRVSLDPLNLPLLEDILKHANTHLCALRAQDTWEVADVERLTYATNLIYTICFNPEVLQKVDDTLLESIRLSLEVVADDATAKMLSSENEEAFKAMNFIFHTIAVFSDPSFIEPLKKCIDLVFEYVDRPHQDSLISSRQDSDYLGIDDEDTRASLSDGEEYSYEFEIYLAPDWERCLCSGLIALANSQKGDYAFDFLIRKYGEQERSGSIRRALIAGLCLCGQQSFFYFMDEFATDSENREYFLFDLIELASSPNTFEISVELPISNFIMDWYKQKDNQQRVAIAFDQQKRYILANDHVNGEAFTNPVAATLFLENLRLRLDFQKTEN